MPVVFATALYALQNRANLQKGEVRRFTDLAFPPGTNTVLQSVLIHSGAGGLGIAAIQVAKLLGAEVSLMSRPIATLPSDPSISD